MGGRSRPNSRKRPNAIDTTSVHAAYTGNAATPFVLSARTDSDVGRSFLWHLTDVQAEAMYAQLGAEIARRDHLRAHPPFDLAHRTRCKECYPHHEKG